MIYNNKLYARLLDNRLLERASKLENITIASPVILINNYINAVFNALYSKKAYA